MDDPSSNLDLIVPSRAPLPRPTDDTSQSLPSSWSLSDFVLVGTVEGDLLALDRATGKKRWKLKTDVPSIISSNFTYEGLDSPQKFNSSSSISEDELFWIIEPVDDGVLYFFSPENGLHRLPLSIKLLVDKSPLSIPGEDRIFIGSKQTTLYKIDARSGSIIETYGGAKNKTGNILAEPPVFDPDNLDDLPEEESIIIGRTNYELTIQSGFQNIWKVSYSQWMISSLDMNPAFKYTKTPDNRYISPASQNRILCHDLLDEESTNFKVHRQNTIVAGSLDWAISLDSPGVSVFDVFSIGPRVPQIATAPTSYAILPQPAHPLLHRSTTPDLFASMGSAFLNSSDGANWYALSDDRFPLVQWTATQASFYDSAEKGNFSSSSLIGLHPLRGGGPEPQNRQTIEAPLSNVSMIFSADFFLNTILSFLIVVVTISMCGGVVKLWKRRSAKKREMWMRKLAQVIEDLPESKDFTDKFGYNGEMGQYRRLVSTSTSSESSSSDNESVHSMENWNKEDSGKSINGKTGINNEDNSNNNNNNNDNNNQTEGTPVKSKRRKRGKRGGVGRKKEEPPTDDSKEPNSASEKGSSLSRRKVHSGGEQVGFDENNRDGNELVMEVDALTSATPMFPMKLNNLEITDKILGYGSHGTVVYTGTFEKRDVAVKRMLLTFYDVASREIELLQESDDHPNVIRYYCSQRQGTFLFMALELCRCSLADVVERPAEFSDITPFLKAQDMLFQIASGVKHLHNLKMVHRDIKPQNILISSAKRVKALNGTNTKGNSPRMLISDFGLSKKLDDFQSSFAATTQHAAGTSGWRAPELLSENIETHNKQDEKKLPVSESADSDAIVLDPTAGRRVTRAIDIFSMGCVFYYVLSGGYHPFGERYMREANIVMDKYDLSHLEGMTTDEYLEATDLIKRMISNNPKER